MNPQYPHCKSVFQNGTDAPTSKQLTQAWIALINQMENTLPLLPGRNQEHQP